MACRCPVCRKTTSTVGILLEHIMTNQDTAHEKWLESYCQLHNIDFGRLLLERINGGKDANKPLIVPLKRDFCGDLK